MPSPDITLAPREVAHPAEPPAAPDGPPPGRRTGRRTLLLALTSSALLWLCYFPVAWGWLGWVALVPFLSLVRSPARRRVIYLSAWAGGLAFYLPVLQWMRVADWRMYGSWIGLTLYCSAYFPVAVSLLRFFDRRTRLPLVLAVPVVWTALEYLRSTFAGGFSWYLIGHTQHDFLPLIQIADVTGAYGVSFLVAAANALLLEILWSRPAFRSWLAGADAAPRRGRVGLMVQALAVLAALAGTAGYGFWRLGHEQPRPGPRVALVQGNVDQRLKNDSSLDEAAAAEMARHFIRLSDLAAAYRPDLIVWPETSVSGYWVVQEDGNVADNSRELARKMAERWHTDMLVGINSAKEGDEGHTRRYNSALLFNRRGELAGRYDKIHRVPFGEYVPFQDWLSWMSYLAPYDFDYSVQAGKEHTRFLLAEAATAELLSFGVLICYEDTDAEVARPYVGGAPPVDFLLNISNDGWFDGTSEHDEHLAVCRFRAVECRRSVARSVNMGISAVVDGSGRVLRPQALPRPDPRVNPDFRVWVVPARRVGAEELPVRQWHEFKKVPGVLLATIPIDDRVSLYARLGDWLPWACWAVVGSMYLLVRFRRKAAVP